MVVGGRRRQEKTEDGEDLVWKVKMKKRREERKASSSPEYSPVK